MSEQLDGLSLEMRRRFFIGYYIHEVGGMKNEIFIVKRTPKSITMFFKDFQNFSTRKRDYITTKQIIENADRKEYTTAFGWEIHPRDLKLMTLREQQDMELKYIKTDIDEFEALNKEDAEFENQNIEPPKQHRIAKRERMAVVTKAKAMYQKSVEKLGREVGLFSF